jgi:predicted transcriptional regulator
MNVKKRKALEKAGWQFGDVQDLLELSDADMAIVEARANLARALRKMRKRLRVSQEELAARIGSSQSRVSSAESGQGTVEQIIRCLVALGADRKKIGREIAA